jgi:hypothetical protein
MEPRQEKSLPTWALIVVIGIVAVIIAAFILFLGP